MKYPSLITIRIHSNYLVFDVKQPKPQNNTEAKELILLFP
jgi:hypothetical protein